MAINAGQLAESVIRPTLHHIGMHSDAAVNLLLGTAAHESLLGGYLRQTKGPALGIYQIEPATFQDVLDNFLRYRPALLRQVMNFAAFYPGPEQQLVTNLAFSTAIARLIYYRDPQPLPRADDLDGLARYYKRVYNTPLGKATEEDFKRAYRRYVE